MALHWLVWLVVGAVIAFISHRIGDKFLLFFYVGLAFIVFGIAKALIAFMLRAKKQEDVPQRAAPVHPVVRHGPVYQAHAQQPAVPPQLKQSVYACPRCRYPLSPAQRFCHMCGLHLR
jgi:hypothetical protein